MQVMQPRLVASPRMDLGLDHAGWTQQLGPSVRTPSPSSRKIEREGFKLFKTSRKECKECARLAPKRKARALMSFTLPSLGWSWWPRAPPEPPVPPPSQPSPEGTGHCITIAGASVKVPARSRVPFNVPAPTGWITYSRLKDETDVQLQARIEQRLAERFAQLSLSAPVLVEPPSTRPLSPDADPSVRTRRSFLSAMQPRLHWTRVAGHAVDADGHSLARPLTTRRANSLAGTGTSRHGSRHQPYSSALRSGSVRVQSTSGGTRGQSARDAPPEPPKPRTTTTTHPSKNYDSGKPQQVFDDQLLKLLGPPLIQPDLKGPDRQCVQLHDDQGRRYADIIYVREASDAWKLTPQQLNVAIDTTVDRVLSRSAEDATCDVSSSSDNANLATSPSAGLFVNHGTTLLWQENQTKVLSEGSRTMASLQNADSEAFRWGLVRLKALCSPNWESSDMEGVTEPPAAPNRRYAVPYRHINGLEPLVQSMCEAVAPVMGAAARALLEVAPDVYHGLHDPVNGAGVVAPAFVYPSQSQQNGLCEREWDGVATGDITTQPFIPTAHLASRVSGIPDLPSEHHRHLAALGISNVHCDPVDGRRKFGAPIVYAPQISERRRAQGGYDPRRPLPSSDLILGEGPDGGRLVRVVTCIDGWICIVNAHYEHQIHGGSYPCVNGSIVDEDGTPHLEAQLVPGIQLLRLVLYSMTAVDNFANAMQAEYDARSGSHPLQCELLRELYDALEAPLDECADPAQNPSLRPR